MYSQYQSYHQQNGGATVSTQLPGMTWNGSSWVPAATTALASSMNSSSHVTTYSTPSLSSASSIPPNPVQTYSQYYHQYTAQATAQEKIVQNLPIGSVNRANAERQLEWYKYYADLSSRAAHHFVQNPNSSAAPAFPLPPAPNTNTTSQNNTNSNTSSSYSAPQQQQQQQQPQVARTWRNSSRTHVAPAQQQQERNTNSTNSQSSSSSSPDNMSLKRYVDRCLSQCSTEAQKKDMMKQVETTIQHAVQQGRLHSINWDTDVALLKVEAEANSSNVDVQTISKKQESQQKQKKQSASKDDYYYGPTATASSFSNSNDDYYGPSPSSSSSSKYLQNSKKWKKSKKEAVSDATMLPANDSYYGPGPTNSSKTINPHHSFQQQQQQQQHTVKDSDSSTGGPSYDYYGPSTATDSETDYIAVPFSKNKSLMKKRKTLERKNSGFNQSSSALSHRAKRFAGAGNNNNNNNVGRKGIATVVISPLSNDFDRFMGKKLIGGSSQKLDEADYEHMKVKGTCQTLEKDYLRLTAPPRPELVRPQPILEQHLANLKAERKRNNRSDDDDRSRDYLWFCSQLKAVRQDCTVQHIQNAFCVDVYETHARIALEEGDLNEYNQCQTQLKELYSLLKDKKEAVVNRNEFLAYRLLYYIFLTGNHKYDGGSSDLFKIMLSLTPQERQDPVIEHALKVRVAVEDVDYHAFFRLRKDAPNLGAYLIDRIVPGLRYKALQRMCLAYRPSVQVKFVLCELGFAVETESDLEYGRTWLLSCGCVLSEDSSEWKTKESAVRESDMEDKKSSLI